MSRPDAVPPGTRARIVGAVSPWTSRYAAATAMDAVGGGALPAPYAAELDGMMRKVIPDASVEQLQAIRDEALGLPLAAPLALHAHLARIAQRHLHCDGGQIRVRASRGGLSPDDGALHWRWLSLELPPWLLVAALTADSPRPPADPRVRLAGGHLAFVLTDRPVAETHVHLSAAQDPSSTWASALVEARNATRDRATGPAGDWPGSPDWGVLLAAADFIRACLGVYLSRRHPLPFQAWLGQQGSLPPLPAYGASAFRPVAAAVGRLLAGMPAGIPSRLFGLAARHVAASSSTRPPGRSDDLLASRYGSPSELLLCHAALHQLGGGADAELARWFWQYSRIATQFYRRTVQRPGVTGLSWFVDHQRTLRSSAATRLLPRGVEAARAGLRLSAYEGRTSIGTSFPSFARFVAQEAAAASRLPTLPEVGLVLHFVRDVPGDPPPTSPVAQPWRLQRWVRENERRAGVIERLLEFEPRGLMFLRGIDVAGRELVLPTYAFAPLVRRVVAAASRAGRRLPAPTQSPLRSFGVTIHAGEDFRTVTEGLRRIHELVEFGVIRGNDRIGHGTALGVDPAWWLSRHPDPRQPLDERLDDLLWELDRYRLGDVVAVRGRESYVLDQVARASRQLSPDDPPPTDVLLEARRMRHESSVLTLLGYPWSQPGPAWSRANPSLAWLHRWLHDKRVRAAGAMPAEVPLGPNAEESLGEIQAWLVRCLSSMEITVEVNPSSNLLIAGLDEFARHPALRLQPVQPSSAGPGLLLSLNSDDPAVFATSLADEYAYAYAALLNAGHTATDALEWIDRIRESGWRSRFTHPASRNPPTLQSLAAAISPTASFQASRR